MPTDDDIHPLARLLGGSWQKDSNLGTILTHLSDTLAGLIEQVTQLDFGGASKAQVSILGPYLARGVLEVGLSMLIARIDPFRVLVLRQIQLSPDFQVEIRNSYALQWRGDFLADAKIADLWKPSRKPQDMTRALLGEYNDHVFWRPSLESLLDGAPGDRGGSWLAALRLISTDGFVPQMRHRAEQVYSTCSKGVHHEFVIPVSAFYDSTQIIEQMAGVIEICSVLGLVMNSSGHIPFCLSIDEALSCFERIQELVQDIHA